MDLTFTEKSTQLWFISLFYAPIFQIPIFINVYLIEMVYLMEMKIISLGMLGRTI